VRTANLRATVRERAAGIINISPCAVEAGIIFTLKPIFHAAEVVFSDNGHHNMIPLATDLSLEWKTGTELCRVRGKRKLIRVAPPTRQALKDLFGVVADTSIFYPKQFWAYNPCNRESEHKIPR